MDDTSKITTHRVVIEDLPESEQPDTTGAAIQENPVEHLVLVEHFNTTMPTKEEDSKLQEIWAFAKNLSQRKDVFDTMWQVKNIELALGAPKLGESRLDRIYRYCKLRRQESMIKEEISRV